MNRLRIVKVGGSLLNVSDLKQRIQGFLESDHGYVNVLIVGGGVLIDQVRQWQSMHGFSDAVAHWMCIDLMSVNAQFVSATVFGEPPKVNATSIPTVDCVFDPKSVLRSKIRLEESWDISSDSIAAAVSRFWNANDLVLLKSVDVESSDPVNWVETGIVDKCFAELAHPLDSVSVVNLRSTEFDPGEVIESRRR